MSRKLTPQQAISRVPSWRQLDVAVEEALSGQTNRSFKLKSGRGRFVLRLDADHTRAFGLDRTAERRALARAFAAGIGPEMIHSDVGLGILVTRYIAGRTLTRADLENNAVLETIAERLHTLHGLPALGTGFDIAAVARGYLAALPNGSRMRNVAEQLVRLIESLRSDAATSFCHNDIVAANLIAAGSDTRELMLIDWEYAGDNDAFFDLASLVAYHELDAGPADTLLSAYTGGASATDRERLDTQIRTYNALHWLWLATRETVTADPGQREVLARLLAGLLPTERI
ncbi:MAG: choline/ethanolamine kinase family protein [Pseudomonadota bacterium]